MCRAECRVADVADCAVLKACGFEADLAISQVHVTEQVAAGARPALRKRYRAGGAPSPGALPGVRAPLDIAVVLFAAVDEDPRPVRDFDKPPGYLKSCGALDVSERFMKPFFLLLFDLLLKVLIGFYLVLI